MSTKMAIALISMGLFATGCASQRNGTDADVHSHGMMCPKCETVWMSKLEGQGTKMQRLSSVKGMTCPDCDAMAKAYMDGDKTVLHDCPTCKVKPVEVTRAAAATHQRGTHP
jgi:hypothetical protein